MYRLTRTSAAAPIPLDTFPTVSYPRAEVEETETKVRPVSTEKGSTKTGSVRGLHTHVQTAPNILGEAEPARSRQRALQRRSKGQKWNPAALGEPGVSQNYIHWG